MSLDMSIDEVVTELCMTSNVDMNLIVEGNDDLKFFHSCIDGIDRVNIICVWGSENVCSIIQKVTAIGTGGEIKPTLGVIDRDYRIPLNTLPSSANLLCTDLRDLECMMFQSRCLDNVLRELASKDKLKMNGGVSGIRALVTASAEIFGQIRYYSQQQNLGVSFRLLDIDSVICKKTLAVNVDKLIVHLNARQGGNGKQLVKGTPASANRVKNSAKCSLGNKYFLNPMMICRGHDIMEILAISFRSLLATMSAKESSRENIEQRFRLNYIAYFKTSNLAKAIDRWFTSNGLRANISLI